MTAVVGVREQQRAASEAAILDAAWSLFARSGPDGTPLREVAAEAGCTHALIARHFGSKEGLVEAVGERLTTRVDAIVAEVESGAGPADPLLGWLTAAREHPSGVRLLVRCALGDLRPEGFPACLPPSRSSPSPGPASPAEGRRPTGGPGSVPMPPRACCSVG